MQPIRPLLAGLSLALLLAALTPAARAADFFVDPALGVDDLMLADGSAGQPWKTLSFALGQVPDDAESHQVFLAAGTYSEAEGEVLPFRLPHNVSVIGATGGGTVLLDTRPISGPTVFWLVRAPQTLDAGNALRWLEVRRDTDSGNRSGRGIVIQVQDSSATPELESLIVTGANTGIDLLADSDLAAATMAPVITNSIVTDNSIGLLATAYTYGGLDAQANPILTNSVFGSNLDGIVFETTAGYGLGTGARRNATTSGEVSHCTFSGNVGSGIVLDDTNLGLAAAGPNRPRILNCILSAADGDYGVNEFSNTSFPSLLENNMFEPSPLGFYRTDGFTDLLTIDEVNALGGSDANFEGSPAFMRDLVPNWRLRASSPGVDRAQAGPLAVDWEGDVRPFDSDGDGSATSEVGFDEAPYCAVDASLQPATPEERCGVFGPLDFFAELSGVTAGFPDCSVPLEFQWFIDGVPIPGETMNTYSTTPDRTAVYQVRVSCADTPDCYDVASAPVVVHELPTVDAGMNFSACIAEGETGVAVQLMGTAAATEPATIETWSWSTTNPDAAFLGGASDAPIYEITNYGDFANATFDVTATVTDSNGCESTSAAVVNVFRGPRVDAGGPYVACQQEGAQTAIPLAGNAETPVGSNIVSWSWTSSVGDFDDPTAQNPSLIRNNVPFTVTSLVTVTVTDDKGCVATSEEVLVTLHPSPTANAGGPYQQQEDMSGTTSFSLDGSSSGGGTGMLGYAWTTDIGSFVPPSADAPFVQLDIVNTGADQTATVCLTVTDGNACPNEDCTEVSVKASPLQPPNDVGPTLRMVKFNGQAFFVWDNAPLDPTHDLADRYEIWQTGNALPDPGGWTARVTDISPRGGISLWQESAILEPAEPTLLFLKIVSRNDAGASCVTQAAPRPTLDGDCPEP